MQKLAKLDFENDNSNCQVAWTEKARVGDALQVKTRHCQGDVKKPNGLLEAYTRCHN